MTPRPLHRLRRRALHAAPILAAPGALAIFWLAACSTTASPDQPPPSPSAPPTPPQVEFTPAERQVIFSLSPLPPLPPDSTNAVADDPAAAHLGQFLFFDTRLSAGGAVSCAKCHNPQLNWTDGRAIPDTFSPTLRHVPSLWNVAYNRWFFWDGRADSLWSQALDPLESPVEHAGDRSQYARLIASDPELRQAYQRVFGPLPPLPPPPPPPLPDASAGIDRIFTNIGKALAAYQRRLVSRSAPFDAFVAALRRDEGDRAPAILSPAAQRGLKLFIGPANCRACHHGPNFTDSEFHDTGVDAFVPPGARDPGRFVGISRVLASPFNALGPFSDLADRRAHPTTFLVNNVDRRGQFKTPTLRNVALTAPYMHRGQLATLRDVVRFYSELPLPQPDAPPPRSPASTPPAAGRKLPHSHIAGPAAEGVLAPLNLTEQQQNDLAAFLESLSDVQIDPALTRQPASPLIAPARTP